MSACTHHKVICLNQHELIRKYRCEDCYGVMMCACDEVRGRRFLAHQLSEGVELETQERIPVTLGFQSGICRQCRGLPAKPAPSAAIPGRASKIKRFYWRELMFLKMERFYEWKSENPDVGQDEVAAARERIEREALEEIKLRHETAPIYNMQEPSQGEVLKRCEVVVEALHPVYAAAPKKGAVVVLDGETVSAETYVARHYEALGWLTMPLESAPLHALFGTMMWLLIQDPQDPKNRVVSFGSRTAFDSGKGGEQIWTHLPEDFGTPGYGRRRDAAIEEHFAFFFRHNGDPDRGTLLELFDYWQSHSDGLRQYLWAHRDYDVGRARQLIEILPPNTILQILRYLIDDYWRRYVGWPDLLLFRGREFMLVEVKSSSDKLSADQMGWINDNYDILKLPFRLTKLHRPAKQRRPT